MNHPIFTITWVRGWDVHETLKRLGVPETTTYTWADLYRRDQETSSHSDYVVVAPAGDWTMALQIGGWWYAFDPDLCTATRGGGEAVSVMRHDYSHGQFTHSVDGRSRTYFSICEPGTRWGGTPDALIDLMREVGLDPEADDHLSRTEALPKALALAGRLTGVPFHDQFTEPLMGGQICRT
ncbi:DUF6461 domain-containing protein [Herbidospora sp. RD11066]